jgi:ubiquinone/menaquinone biosynthesis C-methylase UbiE
MGFYEDRILPHLINLAMRNRRLIPYRERVISAAEGRVLEIGIGSGLNLPFYATTAKHVVGLDPSPRLLAMAQKGARHSAIPVELVESGAEVVPLHDRSFDTVVTTWTLCSIPDASRALSEMRRVLRPGGRLLFVEHGRAPDTGVRWWQDHLTPVWKRLSGGCHLNRAISEMLEHSGLRIDRLNVGYMRGRNPMSFMYEGTARPR